jgi:myosin V
MPKGSDDSWTGKLVEKCSKYKHFDKPRFGAIAFIVKHFSDTVRYESQGFLEKNRDNVSKELVNTIRMSGMKFLKKIIDLDEDGTGKSSKQPDPPTPGTKIVVSASRAGVSPWQIFTNCNPVANLRFVHRP